MVDFFVVLGFLSALSVGLWVMIAKERRRSQTRDGSSAAAGIACDLERIYRPSVEHVIKAKDPEIRKAEDGGPNL